MLGRARWPWPLPPQTAQVRTERAAHRLASAPASSLEAASCSLNPQSFLTAEGTAEATAEGTGNPRESDNPEPYGPSDRRSNTGEEGIH